MATTSEVGSFLAKSVSNLAAGDISFSQLTRQHAGTGRVVTATLTKKRKTQKAALFSEWPACLAESHLPVGGHNGFSVRVIWAEAGY